jgi:hypothetical protein
VPATFVVALLVIGAVVVAIVLNFFAATAEDARPGGVDNPGATAPRPAVAAAVRWTGAGLSAVLAAMLMPVAVASERPLPVALLVVASLATGAWFLIRHRQWRRIAGLAALASLTSAFAL